MNERLNEGMIANEYYSTKYYIEELGGGVT